MTLIAVLICIAWLALGLLLWLGLMALFKWRKSIGSAVLFIVLWTLVTFGDDLLGRVTYERMCEAVPQPVLYRPLEMGAGRFFDSEGRPLWKNEADFQSRFRGRLTRYLRHDFEVIQIQRFPAGISQHTQRFYSRPEGRLLAEKVALVYDGGWVRRSPLGRLLTNPRCTALGELEYGSGWIRFSSH